MRMALFIAGLLLFILGGILGLLTGGLCAAAKISDLELNLTGEEKSPSGGRSGSRSKADKGAISVAEKAK